MKTSFTTLFLIGSLILGVQAQAQQADPRFREGTETDLTPVQRNELRDWASNSRIALLDLKKQAQGVSKSAARRMLMAGMKEISTASSPKRNETLMRMTLNKAIDLVDELERGMTFGQKFVDQATVRLMEGLIDLAVNYYEDDVEFLAQRTNATKTVELPYVRYALDVAVKIQTYAESIADISTQYNVYMKLLGYFHYDLNRSEIARASMGPVVVRIAKFRDSGVVPKVATSDNPFYHEPLRLIRRTFVDNYKLALEIVEQNRNF